MGIHKPELLAPAGGMDQLEYAVHFGADAVYLACDRFGLRQRAANFSIEDISEAVQFAHSSGVQVYITLNASMDGEDVAALPPYLEQLARAGVDAFIMSDLGAVRLARRHAPEVAIHISTQASCMNAEAACMWHDLGAKRIVCAREMSVADIAAMRAAIPDDLELEVFVHGAMCMAVSGRCLISDYLNDRSANKGHCTQPCRWGYALVEETRPGEHFPIEQDDNGTSFIMSSKDLNMLHHLDDLVAAGVNSIKIEGRVKKAYYVATIVNAYRQVLDGADASTFDRDLDAVSHRPYSTGFFYGPAEQAPKGPEYAQTHALAATVESITPCQRDKQAKVSLFEGESAKVGLCERRAAQASADAGFQTHEAAKAGLCESLETRACLGANSTRYAVAKAKMPAEGEAQASADGADSVPVESVEYDVQVKLRNRFFEGDTLEVLTPGEPVRTIVVTDLRHIIPRKERSGKRREKAAVRSVSDDAEGAISLESFASATQAAEGQSGEEVTPALPIDDKTMFVTSKVVPVTVADRAMNSYVFRCPALLQEKDILRIRMPASDVSRETSVRFPE